MAVGWDWERRIWDAGRSPVAGVDEAGRGPLAGPVVAAAVILPPGCRLPGLDDSKRLQPADREALYGDITRQALAWAVTTEAPDVIDRVNILQASLRAMAAAVRRLRPAPRGLLVDGGQVLPLPSRFPIEQVPLVRGDGISVSVAAASILAKVSRDREMEGYDRLYPGYGFARHKGYPTRAHLEALRRLGPSPIHRMSFRPVRDAARKPGPPGARRA
ncbi:MAG: ribonuclease HII [Nitrospinota bacterium]